MIFTKTKDLTTDNRTNFVENIACKMLAKYSKKKIGVFYTAILNNKKKYINIKYNHVGIVTGIRKTSLLFHLVAF